MDFKKSKKYTESYKTKFLNKLNEGKMVDVQEGQDLKVAEVSKELPKNAKIGKDEKQSFEDYKTMYKDVITQKCIEDYGVDTDTKLWEDTAKELYLKSKTYIPTGEEKPEEVLVKKEESKSLKESKNPEDLTTIEEIEEYINNIQDKHTKEILHHILEDEKQQENPNIGYLTMAIRKVSEVENNREKKTEDFDDNTKFLTHILNGVIKDIQDKFNVIATAEFDTNNTNSVVVTLKGNTMDLIDATSYLSKTIRNDDVDFRFDDTIKNNTVQCYITPKIYDLSIQNKSNINESYYVKLFNEDNTDIDTIETETEEEAIQVARNKMKEGFRAVVYNDFNNEAIYDFNPLEESSDNEYQYMLLDRLKTDCEYFLGNGNGSVKHLWAGDIDEQIDKMKELYNSFADNEKPEWITMKDINNYEKKMKALKNSKEKKTEVTERDLSKDLFQDEANRRIYNRLINLDVYLEQLKRAIENNDTDSIIANKSKIKSNVAYLIPALNIKGSVNGLIDYLKATDFDFENNFKETADLLKDLNNEDKKEESAVSDYTLSEIKKVIDSAGNDFTIKVVNSNEDVETKTLNIDREDLISIYNVLGGNKDLLQEDQYENERRRGKPSIKKIAETEFYDNQDWYIQHIKDCKDVNDFIQQEIFEIAGEYNLKEDTAKQVCKEIYNLAIKNQSKTESFKITDPKKKLKKERK